MYMVFIKLDMFRACVLSAATVFSYQQEPSDAKIKLNITASAMINLTKR